MAERREQYVEFFYRDGSFAFKIADGGSIFIDGKEYSVSYINKDYFLIDFKCYNHKSFYQNFVLCGCDIKGGNGMVTRSAVGA